MAPRDPMEDDLDAALRRARKLSGNRPAEKSVPSDETQSKPDGTIKVDKAEAKAADPVDTLLEIKENAMWLSRGLSWVRHAFGRASRLAGRGSVFGAKAWSVADYVWDHGGKQTLGRVAKGTMWCGKRYADLFYKVTHPVDEKTGETHFSKMRAVFAVAASAGVAVGLWFGAGPAVKSTFIAAKQGVTEVVSAEQGYYYTNGASTIIADKLYDVSASPYLPASETNTTNFHAEKNIWHWQWYPETIYDAVPAETGFAMIDYFGWRVKAFDWHPEITDIDVWPISLLPADHPAHKGQAIDHQDIIIYTLDRLPNDHPGHTNPQEITHDVIVDHMMEPALQP